MTPGFLHQSLRCCCLLPGLPVQDRIPTTSPRCLNHAMFRRNRSHRKISSRSDGNIFRWAPLLLEQQPDRRALRRRMHACHRFPCSADSENWNDPENRAFPLQFFNKKTLSIVFALECCASTLNYVPVYFLPLYFQFVRHDSAIMSGVQLFPFVVFLAAAIVVNGVIVTANGRYMPWFCSGGALGLIGSALLYTVDVETSNVKVYGYSILIGTGTGFFLQLSFSVVQFLVPPEFIPKAIKFITFGQLGAPSLVLALVNAVFLNEAGKSIARSFSDIPRGTIISIPSGVGSDTFARLNQGTQQQISYFIVIGLN